MTQYKNVLTMEKRNQEPSGRTLLANEEGSVIILALVMLMLLTLVGTSATNTSSIEIQVAGNERDYTRNFFKTEAAMMQGAQQVQSSDSHDEDFIRPSQFAYNAATFAPNNPSTSLDRFSRLLDQAGTSSATIPEGPDSLGYRTWIDLEAEKGGNYANSYYMVVHTGVAAGASLDMTGTSQLHAFNVYGQLYDATNNERMIVETGYGKRY